MKIDKSLLDSLTLKAQKSPRLRMNYDLRDSVNDGSQKMLNAIEPGTLLPIHRHPTCSEVIVLVRGKAVQHLYDEKGQETSCVLMGAGTDCPGMVVEIGQWHRIESLESGTVLIECKEGPYAPVTSADTLIPEP